MCGSSCNSLMYMKPFPAPPRTDKLETYEKTVSHEKVRQMSASNSPADCGIHFVN